jgi:subtilisin family serine protease
MVTFPKHLTVGASDQQTVYELAEDQLLIRRTETSSEPELRSFLRAEGLESDELPRYMEQARATLAPLGLEWITLGGQRFATLETADQLVAERSDVAEVRPVYYEAGGGPETAATPIFDTLVVDIAADLQDNTLAALAELGLERHGPMSALLAPLHVFSVPADTRQTLDRSASLAAAVAAVPGVNAVEFDWLKLETYHFVPSDTLYPYQWNMQRISAEEAWDVGVGTPDVWMAIIDSGFDLGHPDIPFTPNIDGQFTHFNADQFLTGYAPPYDASPSGVHHGTAVAGIAGAITGNGVGVAGLAGNCQIMPVRLGRIPTALRVAVGLTWAVLWGAKVANLSLSTTPTLAAISAVENAWHAGMVVCAAAGNWGGDTSSPLVSFPARYPRAIAVGASDLDDQRKRPASSDGQWWWGSQFGPTLDVVAPGVNIYTTDERGSTGYDPSSDYLQSFGGTSGATPHVAGLAALLFSIAPSLTNQDVRDLIEVTCDKVSPPLYPYADTAGHDNGLWQEQVGYGRINAAEAARIALVVETLPILLPIMVMIRRALQPLQLFTRRLGSVIAT